LSVGDSKSPAPQWVWWEKKMVVLKYGGGGGGGGGSFYLRLPKQAAAVGQTSVTNFLPKRRRIGGSGGF